MKVMDIVKTEKYMSNGEEKKKYMNVGTLFVYDDGGMGIKIPEGISVTGSLNVYEKKPRDGQPQQTQVNNQQSYPQQQNMGNKPQQQHTQYQPQQMQQAQQPEPIHENQMEIPF